MQVFLTLLGLVLLLGGMTLLRSGLVKFGGSQLQHLLLNLTSTPSRGFMSGMAATALLQSSTALTVMTVSFVDARIIGFENALGLILGSNVGTTITPQLLAFPFGTIAIWTIIPCLLLFTFIRKKVRFLFLAFSGLGIMFLSLSVLESSMVPLAKTPGVQNYLHQLGDNHFKGVLAGTILSALLHSSSATTGIVMILTEEGWLNMPAALAFIFGANIGTCFTALLVSVFTSRASQRVAVFHVVLNIFGVIIFFPFLSPTAELLSRLGGSLSRQVANAHTLFNLVSSLLALPLLPYATKILLKIR